MSRVVASGRVAISGRVAASGRVKCAEPQNYLVRTDTFQSAPWSVMAGTSSIGHSGSDFVSPLSGVTSFSLVENNNVTVFHGVELPGIGLPQNVCAALSVCAKQVGRRYLALWLGNIPAFYDLQAGTVVPSVPAGYKARMVNYGGGVYDCGLSGPYLGSTVDIWTSNDGIAFSYTGTNGLVGVTIASPRLVRGGFGDNPDYLPNNTGAQITGSPRRGTG